MNSSAPTDSANAVLSSKSPSPSNAKVSSAADQPTSGVLSLFMTVFALTFF
jgi:hypothetical protein